MAEIDCTLCRAGFKLPHGYISSLEEYQEILYQEILKKIVNSNKKV